VTLNLYFRISSVVLALANFVLKYYVIAKNAFIPTEAVTAIPDLPV